MTDADENSSNSPKRSPWLRGLAIVAAALTVVYAALFWFLRNPTFGTVSDISRVDVDLARLKRDVSALTSIEPNRSIQNPDALIVAEEYVEAELAKTGCSIERHEFEFEEKSYRNIICSFGPANAERVLLGAHYDVFQHPERTRPGYEGEVGKPMPGADDNASGVAGVLEIARMVAREKPTLKHRLDLVAFTLEEVTETEGEKEVRVSIGSHEYARKLKKENVAVRLMISVEMIGYFDEARSSQRYPAKVAPVLRLLYPDSGNFISVIGKAWDRTMVARVRGLMEASDRLPVYSINAPRKLVPDISWSDHANFWNQGYPAAMVTDTSEFRNAHYHRSTDTPDTLDYDRMAVVVEGLYRVGVNY